MEVGVGRTSVLRSLVRPVSPLSRINPSSLPQIELDSQSNRRRSRSRSPLLASTVYLANRDRGSYGEGEETRRIIVQTSAQGNDAAIADGQKRDRFGNSTFVHDKREDEGGARRPVSRSYKTVNRSETCPILIRISYSTDGRHHSLSEYDRGKFPSNELQLNTWIDCSLRELAEEVREVCPIARRRGTRLHFAVIYPDQRGTYRRRELGVVISGFTSGPRPDNGDAEDPNQPQRAFNLTDDSAITLLSKRFHIGDYIDVAIKEHVPGSLGGWTTGRRPLGPTPVSSRAAANLI